MSDPGKRKLIFEKKRQTLFCFPSFNFFLQVSGTWHVFCHPRLQTLVFFFWGSMSFYQWWTLRIVFSFPFRHLFSFFSGFQFPWPSVAHLAIFNFPNFFSLVFIFNTEYLVFYTHINTCKKIETQKTDKCFLGLVC